MKYLFEMIGLYPETTREETGEDSLTRILLRRLGLPASAETGEEGESRAAAVRGDTVK